MKKFTGYRLQVTVLLIVILLFPVAWNLTPASAQEASKSAGLTPIQQKLEDLKKEIASKAAQIKSEISQKISNKAYIGVISSIQDSQTATGSAAKKITITTPQGSRVIQTNEYTIFEDKQSFSTSKTTAKKTKLTIKDFKDGDFVAGLGDVDDTEVLIAKKLIKSKPPEKLDGPLVWGQIQSVNGSTIFVVNRDNKKVSLALDKDTELRVSTDEATIKEVVPGNFLISVGTAPENDKSVSDFVYLINPNGDLKIEKTASSSATPSVSPKPSASPKKN